MGILVEEREVPCRFGDSMHAVGQYSTPEGCACYPNDRVQNLCGQHVIKGGMIGDYALVLIYDRAFYEMYFGKDVVARCVEGSV